MTPFAQILLGGAHASASALGASDNSFAIATGGGLDTKASQHFAVRLAKVEYLLTRFREADGNRVTQNSLRVSTGLVFRF